MLSVMVGAQQVQKAKSTSRPPSSTAIRPGLSSHDGYHHRNSDCDHSAEPLELRSAPHLSQMLCDEIQAIHSADREYWRRCEEAAPAERAAYQLRQMRLEEIRCQLAQLKRDRT
jgi:hypothetical protein